PGRPVRSHPPRAHHRERQLPGGPDRRPHRSPHPDRRVTMASVAAKVALEARETPASRSRIRRITLRRLWRFKWGVAAAAVLLVIVGSAVFAPWLAPDNPLTVDIQHRLSPPVWMARSEEHTSELQSRFDLV